MWPLSDKILFPYLGKTLFEYQIEYLLGCSLFDTIHVVANGENFPALQSIVQKKFSSAPIHFSIQSSFEQGMLEGIWCAKERIELEKALFVMSSNDFVEKEFFKKLQQHVMRSSAEISICGKKVENYFPGGYLVLDSGKNVKEIIEKPGIGNEPSDLINLVFHFFKNTKKLFSFLEKERVNTKKTHYGYEACLQNMFSSGVSADVIPYSGFWQALKYPWHHLDLMEYFLNSISGQHVDKSVKTPTGFVFPENIIVEEGVKIYDQALLNGNCYIGKDCILGNQSLVRNSHLGPSCVIGHSTEVARSYLRGEVRTHQNYIGDSVFDENISLGAGTRTGNLRLDENEIRVKIKKEVVPTGRKKLGTFYGKGVRIGINTSLMPGIKIGGGSFIGAGCVIGEDIAEQKFVYKKHSIEIKENKYA